MYVSCRCITILFCHVRKLLKYQIRPPPPHFSVVIYLLCLSGGGLRAGGLTRVQISRSPLPTTDPLPMLIYVAAAYCTMYICTVHTTYTYKIRVPFYTVSDFIMYIPYLNNNMRDLFLYN